MPSNKRTFTIKVTIGGRSKKKIKKVTKEITYAKGKCFGFSEYYGPKGGGPISGANVWIYSRQSLRELADTFFHEMTHVFFAVIGGIKKQKATEEDVCNWVGFLVKRLLADYDGGKYGRINRRLWK